MGEAHPTLADEASMHSDAGVGATRCVALCPALRRCRATGVTRCAGCAGRPTGSPLRSLKKMDGLMSRPMSRVQRQGTEYGDRGGFGLTWVDHNGIER